MLQLAQQRPGHEATVKLRPPKKRGLPAPHVKVGCAFCWQWIPPPKRVPSHSAGAWGGRCDDCGALFVLDETGRSGGQAVMDLLTFACDGDVERALALQADVDYRIKSKPMADQDPRQRGRASAFRARSDAKVWFLKLND